MPNSFIPTVSVPNRGWSVTFAGLVEVMRTWTRYWLEIVALPGEDEANGQPA